MMEDTTTSILRFYLVHLQKGPRGAGFRQRHSSVFVTIRERQDLADQAGEVGLLSKLGLCADTDDDSNWALSRL